MCLLFLWYNLIKEMKNMGRPKGGKNNYHSKEEKIKIVKEMLEFNQDDYETVEDYINAIIYDHNYLRPSYALNYKTPIEYRTQLGFK